MMNIDVPRIAPKPRKRLGICASCGVKHDRYRDHDHKHFASYCHSCHAEYMRKTRPKHSALTSEQRKKANARAYANVYQRRGKLVPQPCERCGVADTQKHHEDYSKPLKVRWLCRPCHLLEHFERVEWIFEVERVPA